MNTSINKIIKNQRGERTLFFVLISLTIILVTIACSNSTGSEPTPEELTEEQAIEALIQVIRDAGLNFPSMNNQSPNNKRSNNKFTETKISSDINLLAEDYIGTKVNDAGNLKVRLWLGPDGHIIPKPDWQATNPNVCSEKGQYMEPARTLLEFTIFTSNKSVQLNYIDVETGIVDKSVMAEPELPDPNWLVNAITEAWDKMQEQATIKDATTPCGAMMDLQLNFKTKVTTIWTNDDGTIVYVDSLIADFELTFDEDENYYEGYGPVERHYSYPGPTGNGSCTTTIRAINVDQLTNPWSEGASPEAVVGMLGDGYLLQKCGVAQEHQYIWMIAWRALNNLGWYYEPFTISGWEMMPNTSDILMRKVLDRTKTWGGESDYQITEKGIIEIRKK